MSMKAALLRAVLWASARLSLASNQRLAEKLAPLVWRLSKRHRQVIEANVRACFPRLDAAARERLARQSLAETLKTALELGPVWQQGQAIDSWIQQVHGLPALHAAQAAGRGVIIAAPHLGNWEVLGLYLSRLPDFALLYKPPDAPGVEKVLLENRGQAGARQIPATPAGVRQLLKTLKRGGTVGILPDQKPKSGQGEFAPFFGQPAYTMTLLSRLAAKTGAPVFTAAAIRRRDGRGFDIHFEPCEDAIHGPTPESVRCLNQALEAMVRRAPEQYQWSYKRFSITPDGQPNIYQQAG